MKNPFHPRRAFVLRVLVPGLSLLCPLALLVLTLLSPPHRKDWLGFVCAWLIVLFVSFALLMATRENLCFGDEGIERVSGLRRHRILYTDIKTIKLKMRFARGGEVPVILIGSSPHRAPTEIFFTNYAPGEGRKMLQILSERTATAIWNQKARDFLDSRPPSSNPL